MLRKKVLSELIQPLDARITGVEAFVRDVDELNAKNMKVPVA